MIPALTFMSGAAFAGFLLIDDDYRIGAFISSIISAVAAAILHHNGLT